MEGKVLEKGQVLNVTSGSADSLVKKYKDLFEKNSSGQIVIKKDDAVVQDGDEFCYIDDKGYVNPIVEINNKSRDVEEDEEEEEEEIEEDSADEEEEEEYEYEDDEVEEKFEDRTKGVTKFDGKTFYYFPKPKDKYNVVRGDKRDTETGISLYDDDNCNVNGRNNGSHLRKRNDPMDQRMLGEKFDDFRDAINASGVISIDKKGVVKGTRDFKKDCLNNIRNCELRFYGSSDEMKSEWAYLPDRYHDESKTIKLNNSSDRARMINNIDYVLNCIDDDMVKNVSSNVLRKFKQSFQKSVPECVRYVGYAALCDILKDCTQMKYSDINTEKANTTYEQVNAIIKTLSLKGTKEEGVKHGGKKKDAFLDALNKWKDRYEELSRAKQQGNLVTKVKNEDANLNLNENNRHRGNGGQLFSSI